MKALEAYIYCRTRSKLEPGATMQSTGTSLSYSFGSPFGCASPSQYNPATVLVVAGGAVGLALVRAGARRPAPGGGGHAPPPHAAPPIIRLPVLTENEQVPVVVEVDHPMDIEHHVTTITVFNERTPSRARAILVLAATGRPTWRSRRGSTTGRPPSSHRGVQPGRALTAPRRPAWWRPGGCGARAETRARRDRDPPPVIRLPQAVRNEPLVSGQLLDVQVKIQHPVRTGLERRDGAWCRPPSRSYLTEMDVFLDESA